MKNSIKLKSTKRLCVVIEQVHKPNSILSILVSKYVLPYGIQHVPGKSHYYSIMSANKLKSMCSCSLLLGQAMYVNGVSVFHS